MPTLKEILADKANYQDNLAWNMGNGLTVTLGQLRGLSAEDQSAITKAEAKLEADRRALASEQDKLTKAQTNTANLYTTMTQALEALKSGRVNDPSVKQLFGDTTIPNLGGNTPSNDPFAALTRLETDTLMGPVVQAIKRVAEDNKKAQELAAGVTDIQKKMATNYINGVLEDRYDRLVPADKQATITLESLIRSAVAAQQFSSDSTPNIKWAYKNATAGDDAAAREKAARDDERKKVLAEVASGNGRGSNGEGIFVPQPQNFGLDVHNRGGNAPKPFKSLDEAFAAAEKDTSLWQSTETV
jgi:hypothetical protein